MGIVEEAIKTNLNANVKKLILKARLCDGEVDDRHFHLNFGRVMRVRHFGGHEEAESVTVGNDVVADLDHVLASLLEDLLHQDGLQRCVERLVHVLQEHPLAEPHAVLKCWDLDEQRDEVKKKTMQQKPVPA